MVGLSVISIVPLSKSSTNSILIAPVAGFPFLVRQSPFIFMVTPFSEVNVMIPAPAVAVNVCVCASKAASRTAVNSNAVAGSLIVSSLSQPINDRVANANNPIFLKFVFAC